MTPREFLQRYSYDERLVTGAYYPRDPVQVEPGDTVGVVLMNLGGPARKEDVEPFLYNLFMDPAIIDLPFGGVWRHWFSRLVSSMRSKSVGKDYETIGGGSPINRLTREQSKTLEGSLNRIYGKPLGITFRCYIAMRYWHPFSEEAAAQMQAEGVDKVVLLPLYPQYSKTTTGSSLLYWWDLEQKREIPAWPTSAVFEYAAHPKYVQAVSERIDEALQRFPRSERDSVQLVFSAHGTPMREMKERRDPYCCLIHASVERVMDFRKNDRPFHVSFQSKVGPSEWLSPSTPDKLKALADSGVRAVLLVPIAFVTDHIETAFELDIEVREEAMHFGIEHYEVTSGLNCHPLFIESLADIVASQLRPVRTEANGMGVNGNGSHASVQLPIPYSELPAFPASKRRTRCSQCKLIAEACSWDPEGAPTPSATSRR